MVPDGYPESRADSGDAARGETVFERKCAGCHGPGGGYKLLGPDPANLTLRSTKNKPDAELLQIIHDGKPNMPAWKHNLSEQQTRDVLAYVRTLAR